MKNVKTILNRAASVLGIPGIAGIGLLLFSLGLYQSQIIVYKQRVIDLERNLAGVAGSAGERTRQRNDTSPLADFYEFFPPRNSLPKWLDKVYAMAETEGLDLPEGEYRRIGDARQRIVAYQAVFPVRGSYAQLRRFTVGVLNELPFVSLDDLRLERQRTADPVIDCQIRLTFYLRAN